ncbi:MAG: ABC transporter substrate-binding protein [Acidimicrobiales bacterium]|nr:ABC transporter substrate-binding protein [Acidimicrobiales bacterium]
MNIATPPHRRRNALLAGLACMLVAAACGTRVTDGGLQGASAGGSRTPSGAAADGTAADGTAIDGAAADGTAAAGGESGGAGAGGAGAGSAAATGESSPGVTDTEIRIGASGPLSGITGFLGEEAFGAVDAYFQLINAQGGINGRKLRLITYDDRFDASQTLANVRRLWEQDKVVGILLAFGDPVADYVTRNKIPTVVFGVTPKSFASQYPTVYPIVGNALIWTQEIIRGLKENNAFRDGMRVGILYDTQVLDVGPYVPFLKEAWENAGATVVTTDPFNLTDGDCTNLVLKMKNLKIDYWDFQGLGWVLCASAAQRQQYRPPVGWGGWPTSVAGLATQVGPWVDGIWGGSQGDQPTGAPRGKTAAHDEFVNAIKRYHPEIASFAHYESPATIGYWVGAKLLAAAIKAQGPVVTTDGILKWIAEVENFDTGITPPIISMAPNCKTGSEFVWIGQWKWDAAKKEATRTPSGGYFTSDQKDRYGGKCFLTKVSDQLG